MSEFNLFESIKQGLTEAIEYERGNLPNIKVRRVKIKPCYPKRINKTGGVCYKIRISRDNNAGR